MCIHDGRRRASIRTPQGPAAPPWRICPDQVDFRDKIRSAVLWLRQLPYTAKPVPQAAEFNTKNLMGNCPRISLSYLKARIGMAAETWKSKGKMCRMTASCREDNELVI
jgi:hypothetical protein